MGKGLLLINLGMITVIYLSGDYPLLAQLSGANDPATIMSEINVNQLARSTTVRIFALNVSGSGVLIERHGNQYKILTNWHVVATKPQTILTPDGQRYPLFGVKQLGNNDLAIAYFESDATYQIAPIQQGLISVGEKVFAAGFPMYSQPGLTTFDQGLQVFQLTQGVISLLPSKSLPQGYQLGYTNNIEIGMSGGPIFNDQGKLIGVNGRVKSRDPGFGVYAFEDGTEPSKVLLEQMINASWGIPISVYLSYVNNIPHYPSGNNSNNSKNSNSVLEHPVTNNVLN